ncbi:hypothetical protein M0638_06040 [Roseomonas sp. NAR14]|uniref:Uncharacterized protein n=1 Tax=Roseomonas acroporae TaxID=2937791 RepID=A0A9X1Y6E7_9PROT|nr:hypothetical protein [Roseomonas acroporae]
MVNGDYEAVVALYVSMPGTGSWSELLHGNALPPRQARRVTLPRGRCQNDVRAVFPDGTTREARSLPTCGLARLVLPRDLSGLAAQRGTVPAAPGESGGLGSSDSGVGSPLSQR